MRSDRKSKHENSAEQPAKGGLLAHLRAWPFDWVSAVLFVCAFICFTFIFMPLSRGGVGVGEAIGGGGTVFNPETDESGEIVRLSKDMATITSDENSPLYEYYMKDDRINVLLVGLNENMSDVIMLASYDMDKQKVDIISIPRDTYFYRGSRWGNYAFHKINSVYHSEGVVPLAQDVSSLLYGMPVNYYVIVDYNAVVKIMEAIGGVQIDIPFHMKYDDTTKGKELHVDIPAGLQTIDGTNVMQFLRFRHTNPSYARQGYKSYPGGDIQRIETHQKFVKAVIKECVKTKNIKKVMEVAMDCIKSDLTYNAALSVASKALGGLDGDMVDTYMLPGRDQMLHDLSFWVADEAETLKMLEGIFVPKPEPEENQGDGGNGGEAGGGNGAAENTGGASGVTDEKTE